MNELFLLFAHLNISYEKLEHQGVFNVEEAQFIKEHWNKRSRIEIIKEEI